MTLRNGDLLNNRYLIKQVVAASGDTVIYRAFDQSTGSEVGIKECRANTTEAWQNLHHESGVFAGLRHPNLMRITDSFEEAGQAVFQGTDFVDGKKVFDPARTTDGIPVREAVPIILGVCDAIYYLHHNQPPIVHGEIGLDTIDFSPDGQVILILPGWILEGSLDISKTSLKAHLRLPIPRPILPTWGWCLRKCLPVSSSVNLPVKFAKQAASGADYGKFTVPEASPWCHQSAELRPQPALPAHRRFKTALLNQLSSCLQNPWLTSALILLLIQFLQRK